MSRKKREELVADLGRALMNANALKFGNFRLTSGKTSSYYVDLRSIPSLPEAFNTVISSYVEAIQGIIGLSNIDAVAAIPTAGLAYGSAVAYQTRKPLIYVRSGEKDHGLLKRIEGVMNPGCRVLVIDDLITTGKSIINTAAAIRSEGGIVSDSLVLIDRLEDGQESLAKEGVNLHAITNIFEVAELMNELGMINENQVGAIRRQLKLD